MSPESLRKQLKFDQGLSQFNATLECYGLPVDIVIDTDDKRELDSFLEFACAFWRRRRHFFKSYREYVCEVLFDELNEYIASSGEDVHTLSRTELRSILKVPSDVSIQRSMADDEELIFNMTAYSDRFCEFAVHAIGTLDEGIADSEIAALF